MTKSKTETTETVTETAPLTRTEDYTLISTKETQMRSTKEATLVPETNQFANMKFTISKFKYTGDDKGMQAILFVAGNAAGDGELVGKTERDLMVQVFLDESGMSADTKVKPASHYFVDQFDLKDDNDKRGQYVVVKNTKEDWTPSEDQIAQANGYAQEIVDAAAAGEASRAALLGSFRSIGNAFKSARACFVPDGSTAPNMQQWGRFVEESELLPAAYKGKNTISEHIAYAAIPMDILACAPGSLGKTKGLLNWAKGAEKSAWLDGIELTVGQDADLFDLLNVKEVPESVLTTDAVVDMITDNLAKSTEAGAAARAAGVAMVDTGNPEIPATEVDLDAEEKRQRVIAVGIYAASISADQFGVGMPYGKALLKELRKFYTDPETVAAETQAATKSAVEGVTSGKAKAGLIEMDFDDVVLMVANMLNARDDGFEIANAVASAIEAGELEPAE